MPSMRSRPVRLILLAIGGAVLVVALVALGWSWRTSLLPDSYNVMDYGRPDYGGGAAPAEHAHHAPGGTNLVSLRGPAGTPDARFRLEARNATVELADGQEVDALTFGGTVPGPELRVRQGDLVEVTLVNRDIEPGVTIHWHGVDVPNAEDGVAGVTQDAVAPGESHVYRFRADQVGTFWYHSHESSSTQVSRGLLGTFVIEPRSPAAAGEVLDMTAASHELEGTQTLAGAAGIRHRRVSPGTNVRLRLVNTDNGQKRFVLSGTPFRVIAIDGTDVHDPGPLDATALLLAAGGRYDVGFEMPDAAVGLRVDGTDAVLVLSPDGRGTPPSDEPERVFDPIGYGRPAATPFGATSAFDRRFELTVGRKPGFLDGRPGMQWAINGGIYPDVPMLLVGEGDLVKLTVANDTSTVHPMHLHGHHALVLSRDGVSARGSPWWTDTLDVEPGSRFELAFEADNAGLWMEHCHNLNHAASGLTMHLAYVGVTTPFRTGGDAHNHPE